MTTPIPLDSFLSFCKSLEGQEVCTIGAHAKFRVSVVGQSLKFTPLATGKPRLHNTEYVKGVLDTFNKYHSLAPSDYNHYTVNASYQLALIKHYIGNDCTD